MARPRRGPVQDLQSLWRAIRDNFLSACESLYWLRPRSKYDSETGQMREGLDESAGLLRFVLWPEQRRTAEIMLGQQERGEPVRVVKVKPRQSGDSSFGEVWQFHQVYWGHGENGLTVAHHDTTTASLYGMAQTFYGELPPELQAPLKKLNRKELAWDPPYNNSIRAQTAGFIDIGHGLSISHFHASEIDRWADPEGALDGLRETIPMAPGTSIYIESKANGADGWLHGFWRASKRHRDQWGRGESGYVAVFTPWYRVPEYRVVVPSDFAATPEEREWTDEYAVTPSQIMWYRKKLAEVMAQEPWGGERTMRASYPFTDEEAFQSSGFCIFPDTALARLRETLEEPVRAVRLEPMPMPGEFREVDADPVHANLWVWDAPEAGRSYAIGVDISDGAGQTESVVSVVAYPGYEQVAEWASSRSSVEETAWVARYLAEQYQGQETVIIPEINRNGSLILYLLNNLPGTFSVFRWRYLDKLNAMPSADSKLGWETNASTKKMLAQVSNMVLLRGQGIVRSAVLYEQMTRCLELLPSKRWAAQGGRSDRIIAYLIAVIGAYLDFEGGTVGNIGSAREERPRYVGPTIVHCVVCRLAIPRDEMLGHLGRAHGMSGRRAERAATTSVFVPGYCDTGIEEMLEVPGPGPMAPLYTTADREG